MLRHLAFIFLLLPCIASAQTDTLHVKPDTLLNRATAQLDSVRHCFMVKSDSIKQSYSEQKQRIWLLKQRYLSRIDSIKSKIPDVPVNTLDTLVNPVDQLGFSRKIESLRNKQPGSPLDTLSPAVNHYKHKIDSLNRQLERIQQSTTARVDSLKGAVNNQLDKLKLPKEAQEKVAELTASMDKVNVSAFDSDLAGKLNLGDVNTKIPALPGTGIDVNLPKGHLTNVSSNLPGTDGNVPDLKGILPSSNINTDKLNDITGQAGDIQKQVTEATGSMEGLGKTLESKAGEQVKGLPEQKLPEVPGLEGGVPKTGDEAKQQLTELAKKEAVNHFAGKEAVLTGAMEKMSKYKQKYSSVSSLSEIKDEKHHNELKGKPLRERLVPALTLQFQSWQDLMLDINPSVGYKITPHITTGIGWNQRVAFNIPKSQFNAEAKVYGIRMYGEYTFNKGLGFRLDVETMNTPSKEVNPHTDKVPSRDWIWGVLVGIKQKYPIYKKLKGNAQVMYNTFDKDHNSPYLERVNFRIGLEFMMKKKKSPPR